MDLEIQFPHRYRARSYQLPLITALMTGIKRGVTVWHRRSGKDTTWLNWTIFAMSARVGTYFHIFPELRRGRKVLWDGINREGMKFLDHFPPAFVARQ
jgi:phage terminase large subunit